MARVSTSGSPWAIVVAGAAGAVVGVLAIVFTDDTADGVPALGPALIGVGVSLTAFGAGAVRRQSGRFGGRGWTVIGFVALAATSVLVGILAGDGVASLLGVLGIAVACVCLAAAGVTVSRGVLARRMTARTPARQVPIAEVASERRGTSAPEHLEILDVDQLDVDPARVDELRGALPAEGRRLLYLWVFDAHANEGLIDRWRSVGPVQLLRGGGALGGLGTLMATITGRVGDLIEESADEVATRLAAFDYERDDSGRFNVNTILCGDETWQLALDHLLGTADVVQMDLAGFDDDNQGCAHELGLLVDRVPLDRVLLIVDDSTDLELLRRTLQDASDRMDARSPNCAGGTWVAVHAPLVGAASGPNNAALAARIERQERAVFQLMVERALATARTSG